MRSPVTVSSGRVRRRLARPSRVVLSLALLLLAAGPAHAQQSGQGEQQKEQEKEVTPAPWYERISFSGDFRNRYEGFFREGQPDRQRDRFRLRLSMRAEINDEVTFGLRLGSGDPGKPTSTNQSFTDFWTRKTINIDRAFITYRPADLSVLTVGAGKFGYPVTRTQMVWDDDVNWEGVYEQVRWDADDHTRITLGTVQSPIAESSRNSDTFMLAGYGQVDVRAGRHALRVSVADYRFLQADRIAVAFDEGDLRTQNTNLVTRDASGAVTGFVSAFNLVDLIGRATIATGHPSYPIELTANLVKNTRAATDDDLGIWLSGEYGEASTPGTVAASYTFARIEQDANVSAFAFSEMPGSNAWVNIIGFSVAPMRRVTLTFTAIESKPIIPTGTPRDNWLTRIQGDVVLRF